MSVRAASTRRRRPRPRVRPPAHDRGVVGGRGSPAPGRRGGAQRSRGARRTTRRRLARRPAAMSARPSTAKVPRRGDRADDLEDAPAASRTVSGRDTWSGIRRAARCARCALHTPWHGTKRTGRPARPAGRPGPAGPRGPAGVTGPQGDAGPVGELGSCRARGSAGTTNAGPPAGDLEKARGKAPCSSAPPPALIHACDGTFGSRRPPSGRCRSPRRPQAPARPLQRPDKLGGGEGVDVATDGVEGQVENSAP